MIPPWLLELGPEDSLEAMWGGLATELTAAEWSTLEAACLDAIVPAEIVVYGLGPEPRTFQSRTAALAARIRDRRERK